ncbi:MAG: LodA/GoxA family CTQ-dependent oxidase, partial [Alcanivoracaceae bacterium]|nr:LodA/GoxA family CTQ-dependent oxidase [Alcanivoracaceae bacterium]
LAAGPLLGGQVAGGVTRWMAIPWQTDTASCRDGYTAAYDPYLPTFWPARVPNNMLNEDRYHEAVDPKLSEETRKEAFAYRQAWLDDLPLDGQPPTQTNQINSMVKYFDKLAVVQARPGTPDDPNFPPEFQVGIVPNEEQEATLLTEAMKDINAILDKKEGLDKTEEGLLKSAVKHLSKKKLLTEQDLLENAQTQLTSLIEHELKEDFASTPSVQKLLGLLASKTHKTAKTKTLAHQKTPRQEVGVPEQQVRFARFMPE